MREIKAWSEYLAGHLGVGGQATRGGRRRREKAATVGWCGRKTKLTARPHLAERREERRPAWKAQTKRKNVSREDATDARARWAGLGGFSLRG
jgi:hypothetical protein